MSLDTLRRRNWAEPSLLVMVRSLSSRPKAGNLYNKWPIFDGSSRHIIKGSGNGGGRAHWWEESANSATYFAYVHNGGVANNDNASYANRAPLCFLFT